MTQGDIVAYANRDGIATGDLDPAAILSKKIIPDYLDDLGEVGWRRKYTTITTVAGTQVYDLPSDFVKARKVYIPASSPASNEYDIVYIGEDPIAVANAEVNTVQARPNSYCIVQDADSNWKRLKFNGPADAVYTIIVVYWLYLLTGDDLNVYMPEQVQWPLVESLRMYILADRFGIGDNRYLTAKQNYMDGLERAKNYTELAARNYAKFVR